MAQLDALFKYVKDNNASDLHLVVGDPPKIRLHGTITTVPSVPVLTEQIMKRLLFEILSEERAKKFNEERDLDFAYALEGVGRFRCNYFWQNKGPAAVFRLIPEKIRALTELNLPPVIASLADYNRGLVLVTGPTGSGKSTTLAAVINEINERHARHIVTIEDPLEFVHAPKKSLITHREVGTHAESFDSALRASVREDPDVILVGEMRDLETIKLAITAAEMGFLVFGTLHTNSAAKTIDRIVDVFPAAQQPAVRTMLGGSLVAIVSQLLVKSADLKGRCCANEILIATSGLANTIREGNISMIKNMIQSGGQLGMQTMDTALEKLVTAGKADPDDVYLKATDKQKFQRFVQQKAAAVR